MARNNHTEKPTELPTPNAANESFLAKIATKRSNYWISFISDPITVILLLLWEILVLRI